eukprot:CAMPEP_0176414818 /NCGR_PEP_ID=MMETSP0127-20121128/5470_1 /TAXON_ID=938130 /ORGANISM="Platyophrya macrostoma, Strain WH" /LENGTH=301 /DNA_ID=CAMNT_0017794761 /DNA_START=162 /DNA_END=1067 /DNA_ORIENTATION=-
MSTIRNGSGRVSLDELKVIKLYRAFCTVAELALDRGFTIKKPEILRPKNEDASFVIDYPTFRKAFVAVETVSAPGGSEIPSTASSAPNAVAAAHTTCVEKVDREALRFQCKTRAVSSTASTSHAEVDEAEVAVKKSGKKEKRSDDARDKGGFMVFFQHEDSLTIASILHMRTKAIKKLGMGAHMLIVAQNRVQAALRKEAEELASRIDETTGERIMSIQLMEEDELVYNPTRHETVPKHIPLTPQEAEAMLKEKALQAAQLPRILKDDPIVQYYGLERGRVVRIERNSEQSGSYEMFRVVT